MKNSKDSKRAVGRVEAGLDGLPRSVLDNLLEGCQVIGFDWKYLYVNDAVARHGHVTKEQLLGRTMMEVYPGIDDTAMFQVLRSCMSERTPQWMDNEFVYADGSRGWFELRFEPVSEGVLILSIEITDRKRAEEALKRSNRALRVLSFCNQTIIWASDEVTIFKRLCELLVDDGGYGLAWIGLLDKDVDGMQRRAVSADRESVDLGSLSVAACSGRGDGLMAAERFALQECKRDRTPTKQAMRDGRALFAGVADRENFDQNRQDDIVQLGFTSCVAFPLRENETIVGALTVYASDADALDESERLLLSELASDTSYGLTVLRVRAAHEKIELALRDSEERYRNLVENLDDAVFAIDEFAKVTYISGAVSRYGFSPEEVVGQPFARYIHAEDLQGVEMSFADTLAGRLSSYEFRLLDKAGEVHYVRSSSRPVIKYGRAVGITGVLIDYTEQRRTEEQLRLAQKLEAVGQLAGGVAHDFNNILTVINSYASLAVENLRPEDPMRDDLVQIREAGDRAAVLTRQLLAFSRKQVLKPQVVSLNRIVSGFEGMLRRLIGERIELVTKLDSDLKMVKIDPGQIEQVIMNLVVNARDAMPEGGKLLIETGNVVLDDEYVRQRATAKSGQYVMLSVSDTGCGMDAATKARIFEPFFTTKESGKGTGLGLATVYGIVKQSRGDIWVYSEPNVGTTFKVYVPSELEEVESSEAPAMRERQWGGSETILVVDDEVAIQNLAKRILGAAGYKVMTATDGWEAQAICENNTDQVHLVLCDVVLPGMSGHELAARLEKTNPGMKVLYMSGYTADAISNQRFEAPGTDFIAKPFTAQGLTRMVREVLDS